MKARAERVSRSRVRSSAFEPMSPIVCTVRAVVPPACPDAACITPFSITYSGTSVLSITREALFEEKYHFTFITVYLVPRGWLQTEPEHLFSSMTSINQLVQRCYASNRYLTLSAPEPNYIPLCPSSYCGGSGKKRVGWFLPPPSPGNAHKNLTRHTRMTGVTSNQRLLRAPHCSISTYLIDPGFFVSISPSPDRASDVG